jgi:hypothetical protein
LCFDGDDLAVLLPDLLEQKQNELAPLGWFSPGVPKASEVFEDRSRAVEVFECVETFYNRQR